MKNYINNIKLNQKMRNILLIFILFFSCWLQASTLESHEALLKKIKAIEKSLNVIMGLSAVHIEKNKAIGHNSQQRFFMASTIKLPIALAFLQRVDQKKDVLERVIAMDAAYSVPGSGTLYHLFERKKITLSLHQVLKHMMIHSDNSASDAILQAAQGPAFVSQKMAELGFKNILVNRSILEMLLDTNQVNHVYLVKRQSVLFLQQAFNKTPLAQKVKAWKIFENDIRDTTTPADMANLLVKVHNKQVLSESNTQLLIDIMSQCKTGRKRIRGLLPAGIKVAHKTGTWAINEPNYLHYYGSKNLYRFASDIGIITLPHNKGHIALAVYVKSQAASDYARSHAIALASRAVYDHFTVP